MRSCKQIVYFDNAATTQKPETVIQALVAYYRTMNAPVHRAAYKMAEQATQAFELARAKIAQFIGAQACEIIFTKGATESINFIAATWAKDTLQDGDHILLTELEHHANLLPWQELARAKNLVIKYIPIDQQGNLILSALDELLSPKTKLASVVHVSNALGTHNDIAYIIKRCHAVGARVLVDAAQSIAHQRLNVAQLQADFMAFSAHKMGGPTGIGVLFIKQELFDQVRPYQYGGGMTQEVSWQQPATWLEAPHKYEAGTPPIAQAIGFGAAIDFLATQDFTALQRHEAALCARTIEGLSAMEGVSILGPVDQLRQQGHLVSFVVDGIHAHDVAAFLDAHNICVRAGHYCAQPLARKLNIEASVRASFYHYNTLQEVEYFLSVMQNIRAAF